MELGGGTRDAYGHRRACPSHGGRGLPVPPLEASSAARAAPPALRRV